MNKDKILTIEEQLAQAINKNTELEDEVQNFRLEVSGLEEQTESLKEELKLKQEALRDIQQIASRND